MHTTFIDSPIASIACADDAQIGDGLKTIRVVPAGEVQSKKGVFLLDREAASLIIAAFAKHATPIVVDYEHQSLGAEFSAPDGRAIAAGWIDKIWFDDTQGLMGFVRWNDAARQSIRRDEYRYLSPVVSVRKSDNRAVALHSAALTNIPAIDGMERLAASNRPENKETKVMADQPNQGEDTVNADIVLGQIVGALGIKAENMELGQALVVILEKVKQLVEGDSGDELNSTSANNDRLALADTSGDGITSTPSMLLGKIVSELGLKIEDPKNVAAVLQQVLDAITGSKDIDSESDSEETANSDRTVVALRDEVSKLECQLADKKVDEFLQPYINKGALDRSNTKDFEFFKAMALRSEDEATYVLDERVLFMPFQGGYGTMSREDCSRGRIIQKGINEFNSNARHARGTTADAFVNLALRDEGLAPMTDDELTQIPR